MERRNITRFVDWSAKGVEKYLRLRKKWLPVHEDMVYSLDSVTRRGRYIDD